MPHHTPNACAAALALALLALAGPAAADLPRDAEVERLSTDTVALLWTPPRGDAERYRVRLATSPAGASGTASAVAATDGRIELKHPAGQRPYLTLEDEEGNRMILAERVLPLEGGVNFRDLGGYSTDDGRSVKWGLLFRSGVMASLTDGDYAYLQKIGVRTVCDFRDNGERARAPTAAARFSADGRYLSWDYEQAIDAASFGKLMAATDDPEVAARRMMAGFYRQMPATFAPRYREVFDALKAGDGVLFHCSAGKDRTGLMAALLLSALGVQEDQILADYAMTERVESLQRLHQHYADQGRAKDDPAAAMFAKLPPQAIKALMASDPAYLAAALDQIRADHGSIDRYLEDSLGVGAADRETLRIRYLTALPVR